MITGIRYELIYAAKFRFYFANYLSLFRQMCCYCTPNQNLDSLVFLQNCFQRQLRCYQYSAGMRSRSSLASYVLPHLVSNTGAEGVAVVDYVTVYGINAVSVADGGDGAVEYVVATDSAPVLPRRRLTKAERSS